MSGNKSQLGDYKVQFGLNEYYQDNLLSMDLEEYTSCITKPTAKKRSDTMLLLLVSSGKGFIKINNYELSIKAGSFLCLGPFHIYSIIPENGEPLNLRFCKLDCSVYNYILSCPYVKVNKIVVPQRPVNVSLDGDELTYIAELFDEIHQCTKGVYYDDKLRFMIIMELMGMLMQDG